MIMTNLRKIFIIIKISVIFLICSTSNSQPLDQKTKESLLEGTIRLENKLFNSAFTGKDETKRLELEGKWEELVVNVLSKGFRSNSYYFLLGRAAEGMGEKAAAFTYYGLARDKDIYKYDCSSYFMSGDACFGYKFPDAISVRLDSLRSLSPGKARRWGATDGPLLSEIISAEAISLENLLKAEPNQMTLKGKFETDEEFKARGGLTFTEKFVTVKINTDNEGTCQTSYNHQSAFYKVNNCIIFSNQVPALVKTDSAESIKLANLMDKREISILSKKLFFIDFKFIWQDEFKMSREVASVFDGDLMAGIKFGKFTLVSECPECNSRKRQESAASLMKSIGAVNGKSVDVSDVDWKKDAFLKGSIEESWRHVFSPEKVSSIVIFRKSDSRVLYEWKAE